MASLEEIRQIRLQKLALLKKGGMDPYPADSNQEIEIESAISDFNKLVKKEKPISLVGRIMLLRPQGALTFFNFSDGTGVFQGLIKKDEIGEQKFNLFSDTVDIGDFVEISGGLFLTKREEKTIAVSDWCMLAKSLRPLPEKWHGLQDVEERFRKRYLDALMNPAVKGRFVLRARLISEIRSFLDKAGFFEVETPVLQPLYGGASAQPFITHHNTLDIDLYLRISDELYLKRLLVAGFPKVYEIGRVFRNEGIDVTHNPEFTMLEFYESYSDAPKQMAFVEKMLRTLVKKVLSAKGGSASGGKNLIINFGDHSIDFGKKFKVVSYYDLLRRIAGISDPEKISKQEIMLTAKQLGVPVDDRDSFDKILDNIYKKFCRPKLIEPTFIIDYPASYLPLAKRNKKNPLLVDAFQLIAGGIELVKAFSELNDPIDQRERFLHQEKNLEEGDVEAQKLDEDFIEAMEYGMPPAGGVGIGIDRLVMLLTDTHNIKEVIFFPTMRPRSG